ncbi:MAG: 23S rRNA pseudouridine2457 synthase [Motiliproteus sp.]|jgi:23S rRNA pseudouridine2457 synthase
MAKIVLLNKPFQVLCQFTDPEDRSTLAEFIHQPGLYPAGRLDYDSEGLLLLTADGKLQQRVSDPKFKLEKTYWVQLEGDISDAALEQLATGVQLKDGMTRPARCQRLESPALWPRVPPIRKRQNDITCWIELKIREGRNRQVRRMTAAVGFPTLRLVRMAIGDWSLQQLQPGQSRTEEVAMPATAETPINKPPKKPHPRRSGTRQQPGSLRPASRRR